MKLYAGLTLAAALALGIVVGVWLSVQKSYFYCPVRGLGTFFLCAPHPRYSLEFCILVAILAAGSLGLVSYLIRHALQSHTP